MKLPAYETDNKASKSNTFEFMFSVFVIHRIRKIMGDRTLFPAANHRKELDENRDYFSSNGVPSQYSLFYSIFMIVEKITWFKLNL